jgi:Anti-anti-sigma regulatory factor (antagonist of anti-sigma factor)
MIEFQIDQGTQNGFLVLSGRLTIHEAKEIKEIFTDSLNQVNNLTLTHGDVEEYDLSYLQLLFSLHKTAAEKNKTFRINDNQPEEFHNIIKRSGIPALFWILNEQANNTTTER